MSVSPGGRLTGKLNVSSLARYTRINLSSNFRLSLLTVDGKLIDKMSDLRPNTDYKVIVEGSIDIQVRAWLGVELLNQFISTD